MEARGNHRRLPKRLRAHVPKCCVTFGALGAAAAVTIGAVALVVVFCVLLLGGGAPCRFASAVTAYAGGAGRGQKKDYTITPVHILNPSYVKKGHELAPFHNVFKVWQREIPKPDFEVRHAAKAVRYLAACRFIGFQEDDPVWVQLMNRTKAFLAESVASGADVASMVWACAKLRDDLPQLKAELLPSLAGRLSEAVREMQGADLAKLFIAALELKDAEPELWALLPAYTGVFVEQASDLNEQQLVEVALVLRALDSEQSDPTLSSALDAVSLEASGRIEAFTLPQLSSLLDSLLTIGDDDKVLQAPAIKHVTAWAAQWNKKDVDPHLWLVMTTFARCHVTDMTPLRAIARRVVQETLGSISSWGVAALLWSYDQLASSADGLEDFRRRLRSEVTRRGISDEQVLLSPLGPTGKGDAEIQAAWEAFDSLRIQRQPVLAPAPRLLSAFPMLGAMATQEVLELSAEGTEDYDDDEEDQSR